MAIDVMEVPLYSRPYGNDVMEIALNRKPVGVM